MMNITLEPGTYVVAVSGGVDSMVLLDLLKAHSDLKLIVAHYDHGIRHDSDVDRKLVQDAAKQHGLNFVYDEGNLGDVSEAAARKARYDFLHRVRQASGARAIITAHHQDDLLETAIMNLLRGTGRKGLTSLKSTDVIKRPLINMTKQQLIDYAKQNDLNWREDITNQDTKYQRNYIRHNIIPKLSATHRQMLLGIINSLHDVNQEIDSHLTAQLHIQPAINKLDRHWFIMLPHNVAREVMATWLRRHKVKDITTKMLERLIIAAKTLKPGQKVDIDKQHILEIKGQLLALSGRER